MVAYASWHERVTFLYPELGGFGAHNAMFYPDWENHKAVEVARDPGHFELRRCLCKLAVAAYGTGMGFATRMAAEKMPNTEQQCRWKSTTAINDSAVDQRTRQSRKGLPTPIRKQ